MKYRNVVAVLVGAWFALALSASALGVFKNNSDSLALSVGIAALAPIVLFLFWFTTSAGFRQYLRTLNPRTLTMAQSWRVNGLVFLILGTLGILPWLFALPAGLGDMAIGITAPWVAEKWIAGKFADAEHKKSYISWQILGILDLVTAVTLGTTARLIDPSGPGMGAMTVLPLSLVPTFIVPLLFIVHVISIAQAREWPDRRYSQGGGQVSAFVQP
jgi:hypothetical protein